MQYLTLTPEELTRLPLGTYAQYAPMRGGPIYTVAYIALKPAPAYTAEHQLAPLTGLLFISGEQHTVVTFESDWSAERWVEEERPSEWWPVVRPLLAAFDCLADGTNTSTEYCKDDAGLVLRAKLRRAHALVEGSLGALYQR